VRGGPAQSRWCSPSFFDHASMSETGDVSGFDPGGLGGDARHARRQNAPCHRGPYRKRRDRRWQAHRLGCLDDAPPHLGQKPAKQLGNLVTLRPAEGWPARWDRSIPDAGGK
jgi:hypothetical protein